MKYTIRDLSPWRREFDHGKHGPFVNNLLTHLLTSRCSRTVKGKSRTVGTPLPVTLHNQKTKKTKQTKKEFVPVKSRSNVGDVTGYGRNWFHNMEKLRPKEVRILPPLFL